VGIFVAFLFFLQKPHYARDLVQSPVAASLHRFWFSGWGFDRMYDTLFVRPFLWMTRVNKSDFIDSIYTGIAGINQAAHDLLSLTQTGSIRWYAMGIAIGAVVFLGIAVFLQ
jgi:NADH-quinone oxidoreductase subunit L